MMAALAKMRAGRAAEVRGEWRQALAQYPLLRDYHLYYLALADASAGDVDAARAGLQTLLEQEPDSVLVPVVAMHLGRLTAASNPSAAIEYLERARQGLARGSSEWVKAGLSLGRLQLDQGLAADAHQTLGETRRRTGLGVARRRARREMRRAERADPELSLDRPVNAAAEAKLLLDEGSPAEAERMLDAALAADPSAVVRPRLLNLLATAQHEQGKLDAAERTFERLLAEHPRHRSAPIALLTLGTWRWNRDDDAVALDRFGSFVRRYPRHPRAADALYASGRIHQAAGRFTEARQAFQDLAARFPDATVAPEARWRQGWIDYTQGRYQAAAEYFEALGRTETVPRARESARYWHARSVERNGPAEAAQPLYAAMLADFPRGVYSVWIEERLRHFPGADAPPASGPAADDAASPPAAWADSKPSPPPRDAIAPPLSTLAATPEATALAPERFRRAAELASMGLRQHAVRELDAIDLPSSASPETQLLLLDAYAAVGEYDRVFDLDGLSRPDRSTPLGHPLDRFLYPRAYWDTIRVHGESLGLDPYLVTALIRQESLFAAGAVSPKGARGLMQLMPTTAARLAQKAGRPAPEAHDLERPEVNIGYGTAYLRELSDRYGGTTFKMLAAYNAGEKAVAKWEQRFSDAEPDEFVERISYRETREYVKAVLANYRLYYVLYGGPTRPPIPLGHSGSPVASGTATP